MKSFPYIASLVLVSSVVVFADSPVDGGWTGTVTNGDATQKIMLSLRTDDTKLTGSIIGDGTGETSIQDGTFIGAQLEFSTEQRDGENVLKINCKGLLAGNSITFTCKTDPETVTQEFTVTRKTS